jgi:hypothetical protein
MRRSFILILLAFTLCLRASVASPRAFAQQRDYLTDEEADKIREVRTPNERIKLYLAFAEDRLKKFDYELNRSVPERRRSEVLNGLLNGYVGCVDDGADQIDFAREKQMDVHEALKLMKAKYPQFLTQLQKYGKDSPDYDSYKDTLDDAIEGTKDALSDANDASKEMLPPPVRRKQ